MGHLRGFLEHVRRDFSKRDPAERRQDYRRYLFLQPEEELRTQGERCMDCGVPFCHEGCPLGNLIPDWNDLVYRGEWRQAIEQLHRTNNFPELTGLVCPAPCESACVLDINSDPVTIKQIELAIIERAFEEGWVVPQPPSSRTGKRVAVIGSGPAGMAAADELNKAGHRVVVFERDETVGGLCRFGVPDPKLEKWVIDRRVRVLEQEGIEFRTDTEVGVDIGADEVRRSHDAVVIATGARRERDMEAPGRHLEGIHFAMDYLYIRNRHVARSDGYPARDPEVPIVAEGKRVIVLGGGDTAMDCLANALREGAVSAEVIDTYGAVGPDGRYPDTPWPMQPRRTETTYALEEGAAREHEKIVTEFVEEDGRVVAVRGQQMRGRAASPELIPGTEFSEPADLVLIAIGFTGPEHAGPIEQLGIETDRRTNVKAPAYVTSEPDVFACGDARVGASLIVTAIAEGRRCARMVGRFLAGEQDPAALPDPDEILSAS